LVRKTGDFEGGYGGGMLSVIGLGSWALEWNHG
jgi:hypothetical protein